MNAALSDTERFRLLLAQAAHSATWIDLVLSKYRGSEPGLSIVTVRRVMIRGQAHLSFVYRYARNDVTRNASLDEGLSAMEGLLGSDFSQAHLRTTELQAQLMLSRSKKIRPHSTIPSYQATLVVRAMDNTLQAPPEHNRLKHRWVCVQSPYLKALGVTTADHAVIPAMSRKWKQINKFVEVFASAYERSRLTPGAPLRVADFGCGKGYLTFALFDYLNSTGVQAEVTGIELRPELVERCEGIAKQLLLPGLKFRQGDVSCFATGPLDVMIALHACDTATDHAICAGLQAGASIIMCSPCCHKQLRPQLLSPHPLGPLLQHGIHQEQQAEMLTDTLRAMWLQACGYHTQVFEFVALEHSPKNKMILAVRGDRTPTAADKQTVLHQIQSLKDFYGIREHCLEVLMRTQGLIGE